MRRSDAGDRGAAAGTGTIAAAWGIL